MFWSFYYYLNWLILLQLLINCNVINMSVVESLRIVISKHKNKKSKKKSC